MGSMQFLVPRQPGLPELAVDCAYMVGQDDAPWHSVVAFDQGRLTVKRDAEESGRLITPFAVEGYGTLALSTATLALRDKPYHLALELCRGTLVRVMNYAAHRDTTPEIRDLINAASRRFVRASLQQSDIEECDESACLAVRDCLAAIRQLCQDPTVMIDENPPSYVSRLAGCQFQAGMDDPAKVDGAALPGNTIFLAPSWRQIEPNPDEWHWETVVDMAKLIRKTRRRTVTGPLFCLDRHRLPDWLYLWDDDFDALQTYVSNYVSQAVEALKSHTSVWYVSAGVNADQELRLTEEQRLRLGLVALETLRRSDPQTPALVGVKQPWGEYLGHASLDLSPWQFADIVMRSGLGVSGFVLELELACTRDRTLPRDLLEINQLVDQWSSFGMPLLVLIAAPTGNNSNRDPQCTPSAYLRDVIGLLHSKAAIQGIAWGQLQDTPAWAAGLYDASGGTKPVHALLGELWPAPGTDR